MNVWVLSIVYLEDRDVTTTVHATKSLARDVVFDFVSDNWDSEILGNLEAFDKRDAIENFFAEYEEHYRFILSEKIVVGSPEQGELKQNQPGEIPLSEREIRFTSVALQMSDYEKIAAELNTPREEVEDTLISVAKKLG